MTRIAKVRVGYESHCSWKCHFSWRKPLEIPRRYSDIATNRSDRHISLNLKEYSLSEQRDYSPLASPSPAFSAIRGCKKATKQMKGRLHVAEIAPLMAPRVAPPTARQPGAFSFLLAAQCIASLAKLALGRLLFLDNAIDGRIGITLHVPMPMPVPGLAFETATITGHRRPQLYATRQRKVNRG